MYVYLIMRSCRRRPLIIFWIIFKPFSNNFTHIISKMSNNSIRIRYTYLYIYTFRNAHFLRYQRITKIYTRTHVTQYIYRITIYSEQPTIFYVPILVFTSIISLYPQKIIYKITNSCTISVS